MKQPWFQLFAGDWRQCPELRLCSLAARGLWIDLMCRAHQTEPYGHVVYESVEEIALDVGRPPSEVQPAFEELERRRVFSRSSPTDVFSRRMVLDEHRREIGRESGRRGGNQVLVPANGTPIRVGITPTTTSDPYTQNQNQNQNQNPESEHPPTPLRGKPPAAAGGWNSPQTRKPLDLDAELLGTPVWLSVAARAWMIYRTEKRLGAYTPIGFRAFVKTLGDMGEVRANAAMQFSMARNYQGLIEPNANGHQQPQKPKPKTDRDIQVGSPEWRAKYG